MLFLQPFIKAVPLLLHTRKNEQENEIMFVFIPNKHNDAADMDEEEKCMK